VKDEPFNIIALSALGPSNSFGFYLYLITKIPLSPGIAELAQKHTFTVLRGLSKESIYRSSPIKKEGLIYE